MAHLLPEVALAGAALEKHFTGLGVFRQQVGLVVDEVEWAAVAGGLSLARDVGSHTFSQIARVACVEVAVLQASEDVDVVHVEVSDSWQGGCQLLGGP